MSKLDEETVLNLALDNSEIAEVLIQTIQQADDLMVQQEEKSQTEPQAKQVEEQEIAAQVEATQATAKAPGKAKS